MKNINSIKSLRKKRVSAKLKSISSRPQVLVKKSLKYVYVQLNDINGKTLISFSTKNVSSKDKNDKIIQIAKLMSDYLLKNKINKITFNRMGYKYHGKVKTIAETLRKNKIQF